LDRLSSVSVSPARIAPCGNFRIARTEEELNAVYRIRYLAYVHAGYIHPNDSGIDRDHYDDDPRNVSFPACKGLEPVGTMRLVFDSSKRLPVDEKGFSQYTISAGRQVRRLAEAGKLTFLPEEQSSTNNQEHLGLQKIMLHHAYKEKVDDLIILVKPRSNGIYRNLLLFET
jgi:hypothetical protein